MSEDRKQNLSVSAFKQNVNPDEIYNRTSSTFDKSSVYGRYGFGKANDDISFINASLPGKVRGWLDKQQLDGPITRQEFLDAARNEGGVTGEAEARLLLALAEQRWASFTLGQSASFLDALENVSNVVNNSYKPQLEIAKAYLTEYKKFLEALQNPTLTVVKELIQALRNFFNDLFNTGLYWYVKTSNDIGESEEITYSINNDYSGLLESSFIRNSETGELEYIDYKYKIENELIVRDRDGSPVPILDSNNKKIIKGEAENAFVMPSTIVTPWKVARFVDFTEQLEADLKYSIDENNQKNPKNTPAFTKDAQASALVLFAGASQIQNFVPILANLINALNDVITVPFKETLKSIRPFYDQLGRTPTLLSPIENRIRILTFTNVKNPKGDPNDNYSKFIAGKKPILKWDPNAKNPSNPKSATGFIQKTFDNNPYRNEVDEESVPPNDDETVSLIWMQKQSDQQGKSLTPERSFIRDENSGKVFEIIYVFEEELVERTDTNTETDANGNSYLRPFQQDSSGPYYNQKLICIEVDRDPTKKDLEKGSIFYETHPHSYNEAKTTNITGEEENVDGDKILNWNWNIKNGTSLLDIISEKGKVEKNIKFYQIKYLVDASNNGTISAELGSEKRSIINQYDAISFETVTLTVSSVDDDGVSEIPTGESRVDEEGNPVVETQNNEVQVEYVLSDWTNEGTPAAIRSKLKKEFKKRIVEKLWNSFYQIENPFSDSDIQNQKSIKTNLVDNFRTRSKNPDDVMYKIKQSYNPILEALSDYFIEDNMEPEQLEFLRKRNFWTWSHKDEKFPGPVYGTFVQEESVLFPTDIEEPPPGPWGAITVGDFFNARDVLFGINDFFDRLEAQLEPFENLIANLIDGIEATIVAIENLIDGLTALLDFLKSLGDAGLYVLLIENDFGGTDRILEQIKSAPNGPPDTLKHGIFMILLAGWAGGTSSTGEESNLEKTWQAFLEFYS